MTMTPDAGVPPDEPVFTEPWQAQAFAMTLALHQQGRFTWTEWAQALSDQIAAAAARGEVDDGSRYYAHWLAALETLVAAKGLGTPAELQRHQHAWDHAAHRTPHGEAIELQPSDFHHH